VSAAATSAALAGGGVASSSRTAASRARRHGRGNRSLRAGLCKVEMPREQVHRVVAGRTTAPRYRPPSGGGRAGAVQDARIGGVWTSAWWNESARSPFPGCGRGRARNQVVDRTRHGPAVSGDLFRRGRGRASDHRRRLESARARTCEESMRPRGLLDCLGSVLASHPGRIVSRVLENEPSVSRSERRSSDEERVSRSPRGRTTGETGGRRGSEDAFDERVDARLAGRSSGSWALGGDLPVRRHPCRAIR